MYAILFMMLMANWLCRKVALGTLCPSTVLFYSYSFGRKCGLVCYSRALELLEEWGIELNERGGFGGDFTGTDSDGADAGVAADDDIGTLRAYMRKRRSKEAPESSAGQEPESIG